MIKQQKTLRTYISTTVIDTPKVMLEYFDMKCDHCDVQFKTLEEAQYHYLKEHGIADGYVQCCGRRKNTIKDIREHLLWHLRSDLYKCSLCATQLSSANGFQAHNKLHFGDGLPVAEKLECHECGKICYGLSSYTFHMQREHGDNGELFPVIFLQKSRSGIDFDFVFPFIRRI